MSYIKNQIEQIQAKNPGEQEFNQAVLEVLTTVEPLFQKYDVYEKNAILERITEPDRQIKFRVSWQGDDGKFYVNRGYRVQFNNSLGPYKGGIRFHPSVNVGIIKFLGFEQIFKNALTGLPIGGGKGGSDFDPKGKSNSEIMRFCQNFMTELSKYIGPDTDVPAGDIGVGEREIGYMFGQYKRIKGVHNGVLTGKGLAYGGSLIRKQATGYGLVYFAEQMLEKVGDGLQHKTVCISGAGNVAMHAAEKCISLGAKVLTMSDSSGWIYDKNGVDIYTIKEIKEKNKGKIVEYLKTHPEATYKEGKFDWNVPCDIAMPCATQNELSENEVKNLINNGVKAVAEGANMPITIDGVNLLIENEIMYAPGKAANAGGVSVSALEMSQNSIRMFWTVEEVDLKLKNIMTNIFSTVSATAEEFGQKGNYVAGANILGFKKVADSMIGQGLI